jgi:hypothetical protein
MLTGQAPFRGTSAELMHQHLHAPLTIGELERVPQPVVVLLEVLLEKDPGRRFQTPAELLKAMPTALLVYPANARLVAHFGMAPAKLAEAKKQIQTMPDEHWRKLIIRPGVP